MTKNKKPATNGDEFLVQFKKRDFIIGHQLTSNQKNFLESYVATHYEKSFAHLATENAIRQTFEAEILNPTLFLQAKSNFFNKFHLVKCTMTQNHAILKQLSQMKQEAAEEEKCHLPWVEKKAEVFPRYRPQVGKLRKSKFLRITVRVFN